MLTKFKVENFKSIKSLELELGRVNVFIGENGSGKSNILEAVAMASAAASNQLDSDSLVRRGIRVANPKYLRACFEVANQNRSIILNIESSETGAFRFELTNSNHEFSPWKCHTQSFGVPILIDEALSHLPEEMSPADQNEELKRAMEYLESLINGARPEPDKTPVLLSQILIYSNRMALNRFDFRIFSPENSLLRNFIQEDQVQPLGINGQGLFRLLQFFASEPNQPAIRELNDHLQIFGWFENFVLPERLWPGESFLKIKDKYLDANIEFIDQRSANEGFLFVLFYLSLLISEDTPNFFAIDNIENALNPKLCTKLMKVLSQLAKAHEKQMMITTHSPAILDGLDLNDDEQRLFVVYRNNNGHTVVRRVSKPKPLPGQAPAKLSELFMKGHLGAIPKNFSL